MKKALITGGAGFIGFHLANKLLSNHYKIDLLDNFSRGVNDQQLSVLKEDPRVRLLDEDLSTSSIIKELDQDYDYIFHLAAQPLVKQSYEDPTLTWETNLMGSLNILDSFFSKINFYFDLSKTILYRSLAKTIFHRSLAKPILNRSFANPIYIAPFPKEISQRNYL